VNAAGVVRVIVLGDGRQVRLGVYVAAFRSLLALPLDAPVSRDCRDRYASTSGEVLRQMRAGIHDRINRHDAAFGVGRKWSHIWQIETERTARAVNTPRLRVTWAPHHLRTRLAHRLSTVND
jgi:hypothetical protein